jgi:hypothetical protein
VICLNLPAAAVSLLVGLAGLVLVLWADRLAQRWWARRHPRRTVSELLDLNQGDIDPEWERVRDALRAADRDLGTVRELRPGPGQCSGPPDGGSAA